MQHQIRISGNSIYWKNFRWGTIIPSQSTFELVPRTSKNLFRMFGDGLGINQEALDLLRDLNITFIKGTFNGKPFRVKVFRWIQKGIRSRYSNEKCDLQVILRLKDIFSNDDDVDIQPSLFSNA